MYYINKVIKVYVWKLDKKLGICGDFSLTSGSCEGVMVTRPGRPLLSRTTEPDLSKTLRCNKLGLGDGCPVESVVDMAILQSV